MRGCCAVQAAGRWTVGLKAAGSVSTVRTVLVQQYEYVTCTVYSRPAALASMRRPSSSTRTVQHRCMTTPRDTQRSEMMTAGHVCQYRPRTSTSKYSTSMYVR
jgi:hypothetical protein